MRILRPKIIKKIAIFGFSLLLIATALFSNRPKPSGSVAGTIANPLLVDNKFCDDPSNSFQARCISFIQPAFASNPTYQNVGGNVLIGQGVLQSDWDNASNKSQHLYFRTLNSGAFSGSSLSIDVAEGQGQVNLVAGASIKTDGSGYQYNGTRGASRIQLADGALSIFTGTKGNAGGQTAGTAVTWSNGGNAALTLDNQANLSIGGNYAYKPGGGSWSASSDFRIKKNIKPISNALEKIMQLSGVNFEWINPEDHNNQTGIQGGFIAQDVEKVFPNWISETNPTEKDKTLTGGGKVKSITLPFEYDALMVEAIKEQQQEIEQLKQEIQTLKAK